ncbi:MAG TPA: ribose 5-phosphate isomerase B [Anaerolineae bacterium]|nr:ribose 5-phosphate isomerase B [Anaerolineae bacterium]
MRISVACDHAGFPLKSAVIESIKSSGHEVLDLGTNNRERVDYPDYAYKAGKTIQEGKVERAVVICGSGVGASITANKMKGIYAAVCHDPYTAHQGVEHDGMNMLCLGARVIGSKLAMEVIKSYLSAQVEQVERHQKRRQKIKAIEDGSYRAENTLTS